MIMSKIFRKPFTQQEAIPESAIRRVSEILQTGRLHRYNTVGDEKSEVALLEQEYAQWQGAKYCVAVTSGGQAMQIALRAMGVKAGDKILANAYTLAPVPGAIFAVGAVPVFVEIDENWHINLEDLKAKAKETKAKYLMLSHMRGHIADMDGITKICDEYGIELIEDCAHTMGAKWQGRKSGNFGRVACFSTQTYKHINSGEGGLITTDDATLASRAVVGSGSYMLYEKHGAIPEDEVFLENRLDSPNCSARMDNMRAAILRAQLPNLNRNIERWNNKYRAFENGLGKTKGLTIAPRLQHEEFVGSSFQFKVDGIEVNEIPEFIENCLLRGVEIKWFGAKEPVGFTSRYDSWHYLDQTVPLPKTLKVLSKTCDMRVPLTFSEEDCRDIAEIISEEVTKLISK